MVTLFLGCLMIFPHSVFSAQTSSLPPISYLKVDAKLNNDGGVSVNQKITYMQTSRLNWQLFSKAKNITIKKDGQDETKSIDVSKNKAGMLLSSKDTGVVWEISYQTYSTLIRHDDRDQFFLKIIDTPLRSITAINAKFSLPDGTTSEGLNGNIYTIGGATGTTSKGTTANQLNYRTSYSGPNSLATMSASWPKSVLNLTKYQEIRLSMMNMDILPWIILGLFMPLLGLMLLLLLLYWDKRNYVDSKEQAPRLPVRISPLLVGVIVNKKIFGEGLVGMLIDLCQRGYLVIVKKNNEYYLSKRKSFESGLEDFEREIVEQIFVDTNKHLTSGGVEMVNKKMLYSPKVKDAFDKVYERIANMNYYKENPHYSRVKYKLIALFLYFASAASLIYIAVANMSPYLIIPLAGTILISYAIIKISPQLVHYTKNGLTARYNWLSFANFLSSKSPLPLADSQNSTFDRFLPYAIALHVEQDWSKRFQSLTIAYPDWLVSYEDKTTEDMSVEVVEFGKIVSKFITNLKGPVVD